MKELLQLFPRPSHYLGCEPGSVRKDPATVSARVALAFPDLYEVGMSYTGQALLYNAVNRIPHLWAERAYAPTVEAAQVLKEHGAPLCTLESDTPLAEVDAIGFHLTHELCYTNVLFMLDLAGIPLHSTDRLSRPLGELPLVLAGGGCAFNAEPVAPFLDMLVLGDGEVILPEILEALAAAKERGCTMEEFLRDLAGTPGVYVPAFFQEKDGAVTPLLEGYEQVEKRLAMDLDALPYPSQGPQPFGAVHDRLTIEIARGCTRGCRFCHAGIVYRPVRERSLERLQEIMAQGLAASGYGEMSFLSLSTGDFSALGGLFNQSIERCRAEQVSISLPSLRVGSVNEDLMEQIAGIRRTGATLAPEAGSQRLRDVINKGVTEEQLLEHAAMLFRHGWRSVKLYFMIGLPSETQQDLEAIVDLCLKVEKAAMAAAGEGAKHRMQVTAAISPFVPKPHTPFQWERQLSLEEIRERIGWLRERFRRHKRLKMRWHTPEMSWLEGIFSRAGRSLAPVVERAWEKGALFSSWNDHLNIDMWREALAECGFTPEDQAALQGARPLDAPLPWDHLLTGVEKRFLLTERQRALGDGPGATGGKLSPDCRFGDCRSCGVCTFKGRTSTLQRQAADMEIYPVTNLAARDQENAPVKPEETSEATATNKPDLPEIGQRNLHNKAQHLRLWYSKHGGAAYLSQLELQSVFERAMRRGRLALSFSQGYHPLPLLSFSRALPVAVESDCEYLDLFLREEVAVDAVCDLLAPALPAGLICERAESLPMTGKQPQSVAEEYLLELDAPQEVCERFYQAWESFAALEHFAWSRETKKGLRTRDIRPLFARITPTPPQSGKLGCAVHLLMDWREVYINPLAMAKAILEGSTPTHALKLSKLKQIFPDAIAACGLS